MFVCHTWATNDTILLMEWIPKPFNTHAKQADMEWFPTQFNTNAKCLGASICCRTAAGCILMPLFTIQSCYIRAQQLRKLGKLLCYYLDKFNHIRVLICHKQKCKAALQSGPRSKGVLLPGLRWILDLVNSHLGKRQILWVTPELQMMLSCISWWSRPTWNGFHTHSTHIEDVWEHPYAVEQQLDASSCHHPHSCWLRFAET